MTDDMSSFVINFSTYFDASAKTIINSYNGGTPLLNSNIIIKQIERIQAIILRTGSINSKNLGTIRTIIASIIAEIEAQQYSTDVTDISSTLESSLSSITVFSSKLENLKNAIESQLQTTVILPNDDSDDSESSSISSTQQKRQTYTTTSQITSGINLEEEISTISENNSEMITALSTLVTSLKTSVSDFNKTFGIIRGRFTSLTSVTSTFNRLMGTSSQSVAVTPIAGVNRNNFFNNIVSSFINTGPFVPRASRTRRNATPVVSTSTVTNVVSIPTNITTLNASISGIKVPAVTTTTTTTTTTYQSSYQTISTKIKDGTLNVNYTYFPSDSTTSTKSFSFYLTPKSLVTLSIIAYQSGIELDSTKKTELVENAGLTSDTSDESIWKAYLITILTFLSQAISTQIYPSDYVAPSISSKNSYNYMLNYEYLETVGNFGMNIIKNKYPTDVAALIGVGIPNIWPDLMHKFNPNAKKPGTALFQSSAIMSVVGV